MEKGKNGTERWMVQKKREKGENGQIYVVE